MHVVIWEMIFEEAILKLGAKEEISRQKCHVINSIPAGGLDFANEQNVKSAHLAGQPGKRAGSPHMNRP